MFSPEIDPMLRFATPALATLPALLAACAVPPAPTFPGVPEALKPSTAERPAFVQHARGVQIYRCERAADGTLRWTFVAPEAELFADSASKAVIGSHGAGPFWQALDGSRVTGQVLTRIDAPARGHIPWLLLAATPGPAPGLLASVSSIQRVNTVGGIAPGPGCGAAEVGQTARVPYTADYVFFVRTG